MFLYTKKVKLSTISQEVGTGWLPILPDLRDYSEQTPMIQKMIKKLKVPGSSENMALPEKTDLRLWCSPIENQGVIGSCTANAAIGIVEYFEKRAFGKYIDGSRLFVYKTTRNLMGVTGDTGAWIRNAMGALVYCGIPPAKHWPYTDQDSDFDKEPTAFVYSIAAPYKAVNYFCHDPQSRNLPPVQVLLSVKKCLAAGIPAMFGFFGFSSFEQGDQPGHIPFPGFQEQAQWGHAIVAVGYDDKKKIKNMGSQQETTGAILIRNSWGLEWGDQGYGWLPYQYLFSKFAVDFWSLLSMDWVDSHEFGL